MRGRYHRLLQGRNSHAETALESLEDAPTEVDLSDEAIRKRLTDTHAALREFVRRELGDDERLHEIVREIISSGGAALRALRDDESQLESSPELLSGLEAIARTDGSRPSFLIRDGRVDVTSSPIGSWADRLAVSQDQLDSAIACVGRINLGTRHIGTGFLIKDDLILTNRHVLQDIADIDANGNWTFKQQGASIDFGFEHRGRESVGRRNLARVLFVGKQRINPFVLDHRKLDLALIELGPGDATAAPLSALSLGAGHSWAVPGTTLYTIGYPGPPRQNLYPATLLEQLFQSTYGHKRLAPGELITGRAQLAGWSLAQDATTLGGNSGSALLVVGEEMVAAGLHYGGQPQVGDVLGENWGHVLGSVLDQTDGFRRQTLGEILEQRGVQFLHREPPVTRTEDASENPLRIGNPPTIDGPLFRATNREVGSAQATVLPPTNATLTAQAQQGSVTFTVPLQITVGFGPVPSQAAAASVPSRAEGLFGAAQPMAAVPARFVLGSLNTTEFNWDTALSLALASKLSYSSLALVQSTALSDWRLSTAVFLEANETQCFVASSPDVMFVAFRGTAGLGDWIADLNVGNILRPYGTVHRGFYFAYEDIRLQLEQALQGLGERRLMLTGHSLGAALATIAACELPERFRRTGIYTFGQPRIGFNDFRTRYDERFGHLHYRFVNDDDIVTRIPPGFQHVGRLFHFDAQGSLESVTESVDEGIAAAEPPPLSQPEFDRLRSDLLAMRAGRATGEAVETAAELEGFFPSISDHSMDEYIRNIAAMAAS